MLASAECDKYWSPVQRREIDGTANICLWQITDEVLDKQIRSERKISQICSFSTNVNKIIQTINYVLNKTV